MTTLSHLRIQELRLLPGQEWTGTAGTWHFLRIASGAAYWLGPPRPRPLTEGEMLVVGPAAAGVVRASQLNEVVAHGFSFAPDLLGGLLTLTERRFFESDGDCKPGEVQFLPSTHPATQRFAALVTGDPLPDSLARRLEALGVVAVVFEHDLARQAAPTSLGTSATHRFQQFIAQMPDTELINHAPTQLARLCGCSPRHFTRLFRKYFGASVRARQTELRLRKACQLLGSTDAKIIEVALDSGYRNLSLFNALFKRRFHLTPSEWRQRAAKKDPGNGSRIGRPMANGAKGRQKGTASSAGLCGAIIGLVLLTFAVVISARAGGGAAPELAQTNAVEPGEPLAPEALECLREVLRQKMDELDGKGNLIIAGPGTETNAARASAASTNGPVFRVIGYQLRGNTILPRSVIAPILLKYTGPALTFDSIAKARADLQMAYRERGYVTVAVGVPPQQLTNGIVKVQITEGRLAQINVLNNRHFSSNNIMRELPSLRTNIILNALVFQQELDRANANRDRQIYPVIAPGPDPGTSVLDLKVKDRLPLHVHLELNNYATPDTPALRVNCAAVHDNLWQLDHQMGLQYSFSPKAYKEGDYNFYDEPLIANYSAFYRLPLSGVNGLPRDHEYVLTDFGYDEAARRFRPPPPTGAAELLLFASRAFTDTGQLVQTRTLTPNPLPPEGGLQVDDEILNRTLNPNEDVGARFSIPFASSQGILSTISAGVDFKNYRSTLIQTHSFQATLYIPAFGTNGPPWSPPNGLQSQRTNETRIVFTSVQYLPLSFNWDVTVPDRYGRTTVTFRESFNLAGVLSGPKDFQEVAISTNANGSYLIVGGGVTRDQKLSGDWGVRLQADGQWANQPLISNEQMSFGGQAGPRGYLDGAEYGDTGWRVQCEPHSPYLNLGLAFDKVPMIARFYTFVDYGERYLLDPGRRQGSVSMLGAGTGMDLSIGEHCDMRVNLGVPLLDIPGQTSGHLRTAFSLGVQF